MQNGDDFKAGFTFKPIGVIRSPFKEQSGTPIQPRKPGTARGQVVVDAKFTEGLLDLDGFSHIWLIYYCHRAGACKLRVKPFLDDGEHGLFAIRAPSRPNPIGMSAVKLLGISKNVLEVDGLDVLDDTPLLDIKPYVPAWDSIPDAASGWLEGRSAKGRKADDRFD